MKWKRLTARQCKNLCFNRVSIVGAQRSRDRELPSSLDLCALGFWQEFDWELLDRRFWNSKNTIGGKIPPLTGKKISHYRGAKVWHGQKSVTVFRSRRLLFPPDFTIKSIKKHTLIIQQSSPSSSYLFCSCNEDEVIGCLSLPVGQTHIVSLLDWYFCFDLAFQIHCSYLLLTKTQEHGVVPTILLQEMAMCEWFHQNMRLANNFIGKYVQKDEIYCK